MPRVDEFRNVGLQDPTPLSTFAQMVQAMGSRAGYFGARNVSTPGLAAWLQFKKQGRADMSDEQFILAGDPASR